MAYEFIKYETSADGITTITLNRPPVNAFNAQMRDELIHALKRFDTARGERISILTGAGKRFSAGEDLRNVNLEACDMEMSAYASQTLEQYHAIVRHILSIGKPIIALLNGEAAGAGMSIALACDYRIAKVTDLKADRSKTIMRPAFADLGLIADSGMTATLPRLAQQEDKRKIQAWYETPGRFLSLEDTLLAGLINVLPHDQLSLSFEEKLRSFLVNDEKLLEVSPLCYRIYKAERNKALLYELERAVFAWEISAQTECLQSQCFKQRAKEFLDKQN